MRVKSIILVCFCIMSIGCVGSGKYKQNPSGIAETIESEKLDKNNYLLNQIVYFTKNNIEPLPTEVLKKASNRKAYDLCGGFREIKNISFEPVISGSTAMKTKYSQQASMKSLISCIEFEDSYNFGVRKTFVDNKNLEILMVAYEVEFEDGFDLTQFLEDEIKVHAEMFCGTESKIESVKSSVANGYSEFNMPEGRLSLMMFQLDGTVTCQ